MLSRVLTVSFVSLILVLQAFGQTSLTAVLSIDPVAVKSTDRLNVTLTGRYICGPLPQPQPTIGATFASISGTVSQASGRQIGSNMFSVTPTCDMTERTFEASVAASNLPWHGGLGRARVMLNVQNCENYPCDIATASQDVQIHIR